MLSVVQIKARWCYWKTPLNCFEISNVMTFCQEMSVLPRYICSQLTPFAAHWIWGQHQLHYDHDLLLFTLWSCIHGLSLSDSVSCSTKFVPPCTIDYNLTLKEFGTSSTKLSTPAWDLPEQAETFYLAAAGLVAPTSTLPRTSSSHLQGTWGAHPQNGNAKGK
jgi:hypothetical protein